MVDDDVDNVGDVDVDFDGDDGGDDHDGNDLFAQE